MEEVEYKDIVGYEKDVLDTFFRVVNEAGPYDGIFGYRTYADCGFCIQKKGDAWVVYHMERACKGGYREYKDVYDMATDLFEALDKEGTDYCVAHFPKKEEFTNKKKGNGVKNMKLYAGCLILVDILKGFLEKGALADQDIARIVPRVVELIEEAKANGQVIVVVGDWHTKASIELDRFGGNIHCEKNKPESELVDAVREALEGYKNVIYVKKNSTSFMEAPKFRFLMHCQVGLIKVRKLLRRPAKIFKCGIAGCCTDICVTNGPMGLANYLDQWNVRHEIVVHEDAIATYAEANRQEYVEAAKILMKQQGIEFRRGNKKVA